MAWRCRTGRRIGCGDETQVPDEARRRGTTCPHDLERCIGADGFFIDLASILALTWMLALREPGTPPGAPVLTPVMPTQFSIQGARS